MHCLQCQLRGTRSVERFRTAAKAEGDLVTIALPNGCAFFEAVLASWKLGATPNPISSRLPEAEQRAIIELASPALVIGAAPGACVGLASLPADHEPGQRLRTLLADADIDTQALVVDQTRPTTRKTRYVAKTLQVLRVDHESRAPVGGDAEARMLEQVVRQPVHACGAVGHQRQVVAGSVAESVAVVVLEHVREALDRAQRRLEVVRDRLRERLELLVAALECIRALL